MNPESQNNQLDLFIPEKLKKTDNKQKEEQKKEQKERDGSPLIANSRLDFKQRKEEAKRKEWEEKKRKEKTQKKATRIRCRILQTTEEDFRY